MLNPNNLRFLPLLFVVLAISVRLAPEHIGGDEHTRKLTSTRYYWSCEPCSQYSFYKAYTVGSPSSPHYCSRHST